MVTGIIGLIFIIFIAFLPKMVVEIFKSKEEKEMERNRGIANTRWEKCLNGIVRYVDMQWYEKILTPYGIYLKKKKEEGYDPTVSELPSLLRAIDYYQTEMLKCYKDNSIFQLERKQVFCISLESAVLCGLTFAIKEWQGNILSFVKRYAPAIIVATKLRGHLCSNNRYFDDPSLRGDIAYFEYFTDRANAEGGLSSVKDLYIECLKNMEEPGIWSRLKDHYIARIKEIEKQMQAEIRDAEIKKRNEKRLEHQKQLESLGGFKYVNTGEDYERFVMYCVKDAGHSCQKVGGTGDYGADLVADVNGKNLVIQCKFYSTPVGYDAIQQVYAAKSIYKGTWCCVVSNAVFTRQAITGARKLGVKLLSHIDIAEYMKSLK